MKQRRWSADEKLAIVLEGLKGKRSVADICREHQISQTLYYRCLPAAGGEGGIGGGDTGGISRRSQGKWIMPYQ